MTTRTNTADHYAERHLQRPEAGNMEGVTIFRKTCFRCGKHKTMEGSTRLDIGSRVKKFVCRECSLAVK